MFIIERNIPVPNAFVNHKSTVAAMNVGDSYMTTVPVKKLAGIYMAFNSTGRKCTIRKQSSGAYRVWRIA